MPTAPGNLVLYGGGKNNPSNAAQVQAGITGRIQGGKFDWVTYSITGLVPGAKYDLYINGKKANDGADQIIWIRQNNSQRGTVPKVPGSVIETSGTVFAASLNKNINIKTLIDKSEAVAATAGAQNKNISHNASYTFFSMFGGAGSSFGVPGLKAGNVVPFSPSQAYGDRPSYFTLKDAPAYGYTKPATYPYATYAILFPGAVTDPANVCLLPFSASSNGIISLRVSNTSTGQLFQGTNALTLPNTQILKAIDKIELRGVFQEEEEEEEDTGGGSPSEKRKVWGNWSDYKPYRDAEVVTKIGDDEWNEPTTEDYPNKEIRTYSGENLLSEVSLYFDYAQTFSVPKSQVDNSGDVILDSIDLFFQQKPDSINNLSGRENPGVSLFVCETDSNGGPNLTRTFRNSLVYKTWDDIQSTTSCDDITSFAFEHPVKISTDKLYAFVINFEDPTFALGTAKQGAPVLSATQEFTGIHNASGYSGGQLFRASNYQEIDKNPATNDQLYQPLEDEDLKFRVNIREYDTENTYFIELVNENYEFIKILDLPYNARNQTFSPGQMLYQEFGNADQNCEYRLEGTVQFDVLADDTADIQISITDENGNVVNTLVNIYENMLVTGLGTKFLSQTQPERTLFFYNDKNSFMATPSRVLSDNYMTIQEYPGSRVVPGETYYFKETCFFNLQEALLNSNKTITLVGIHSNASDKSINKTIFTNTGINYIQINNGGSGYSNGDYFVITGTTNVPARAVVYTNNTGVITSTIITQAGYGFNPTVSPTVGSIYASPGVLSNGSSADLEAIVGGQIASINLANTTEDILEIENRSMDIIVPDISVEINRGTVSNYQIVFSSLDENSNYNIDDTNYLATENGIAHNLDKYSAKLMSRSNEILYESTLGASSSEGKSSIIKFNLKADHAYQAPIIATEMAQVHVFSNEINNDASNEILPDSGNAISRHITNKLRFAENKFAEDIRVFMTVWQPQGTELKVYAKIHNSEDEDKFDDKYWSELEIKQLTNNRQYSNKKDYSDYVEIQYGFKQQPRFTGKAFDIEQIVIDGSNIGTVTTEQEHILVVGHDVTLTGTATALDNNTYTVATIIDDVTFTLNSLPIASQTISQGAYERVIHAPSATITGDIITFSGDYSGIANGDILGVYDADFSEEKNTIVSLANTINTSTGVGLLSQDLTDSQLENIQLSVDLIHPDDLYQAFNNIDNDNVVRYVNSANSIIDYYDSVAVKIVPLAENNNLVPRVDDLRVIGVSS